MIGTKLGPYRIVAPLGAGGMGEVYRGRDERLGRDVAIKVLPRAVADNPERLARFEREARALAALSHPNILAIHDFSTDAGVTYAVTELLEGETLRHRLEHERLPWRRSIEIAAAVADGLSAAHGRGIIHRDIKPENIFVTGDGRVKVLDFGLARLEQAARAGEGATTVTDPGTVAGTVLGTVGYMAPEQVRGQAADARSDIFTLGCLLYEMLAGKRAFARETATETMAAILKDPAPEVSVSGVEVTSELNRVVSHCLEKNPGERFQSASDLSFHLRSLLTGAAIGKAGGIGLDEGVKPETPSIVVLPFANLSPDPDQEYFCDGITEELIGDLSKIRSLRVISRTSSMMLKGTKKDIRTIAREVRVQYVLEGSVRKAGANLRIAAQLIDASSDDHRWSGKYAGTMEDVFDIQEKVSRSIVDALKLELSLEEQRRMAERPIANAEAYEWYVRGSGALFRYTEDSMNESLRCYQQALAITGANAMIYCGIAYTHLTLSNFGVRIGQNRQKAEEFARMALALNPEMPRAQAILGFLPLWYQGKGASPKKAMHQLKRVLAADPNEPIALLGLMCVYFWAGRMQSAISIMERLLQLEPLEIVALWGRGGCYFHEGQYDLALQEWQKFYDIDPNHWAWQCWVAHALAYKGRNDEALAMAARCATSSVNHPFKKLALMLIHALRGEKEAAIREMSSEFHEWARRDPTWSYRVASDFAYLDAKEEALDWLENAIDLGHINYPFFAEKDLFLTRLRGDPRFVKLMQRVKREWEEFEA